MYELTDHATRKQLYSQSIHTLTVKACDGFVQDYTSKDFDVRDHVMLRIIPPQNS